MSVLACDRAGCENIMCTRYSHEYGYICDDCFEELKKSKMPVPLFMRIDKKIARAVKEGFEYDKIFSDGDLK
jgi:hypothetical protein